MTGTFEHVFMPTESETHVRGSLCTSPEGSDAVVREPEKAAHRGPAPSGGSEDGLAVVLPRLHQVCAARAPARLRSGIRGSACSRVSSRAGGLQGGGPAGWQALRLHELMCSQPFQGCGDPSHELGPGFCPSRGTWLPPRHGEWRLLGAGYPQRQGARRGRLPCPVRRAARLEIHAGHRGRAPSGVAHAGGE
jgi:hypothetical protein